MNAMLTGLVMLLLFVVAVSALPVAYAAWRRLTSRDGELQIWRAMSRRGLVAEDAAADDVKLSTAVRRCVLCPSILDCDDWLASGRKDGLARFCPNAPLLRELEARKARRDTP